MLREQASRKAPRVVPRRVILRRANRGWAVRRWNVECAVGVCIVAGFTLLLLVIVGRFGPSASAAATCTFTTGSDWNTAADWDCGHVPASGEVAVVDGLSVNIGATPPAVGAIQIVNGGAINFTAGDAVLSDDGDLVTGSATVSGAGSLSVAGNLTRSPGDFQFSISATNVTIGGASSVIDHGTVCVAASGSLTLDGLLTVEDGSDPTVFNCFSGSLVIGAGGELRSTRTTPTTIDTPITNEGVVTDAASTLTLFNSGTSDGLLQALDNPSHQTQLAFGSTWTVNGAVSATGSGGIATVGDTTTLTPSATLSTPSLALTSPLVLQGGTPLSLTNLTFTGGMLTSSRPVTVTHLAAAAGGLSGSFTLTVPADGTFARTGINTDTFSVNNGSTLTFDTAGVTSGAGRMTVAAGATVNASQLTLSGGGITVDGSLNAPLTLSNGAYLAGLGTTGDVTNTSGFVNVGDPLGTLTVNGNYTQASGGTLSFNITGTTPGTFSALDVTGTATLAGVADVKATIAGHDGDTWPVLAAATRSGAFASTVTGPIGYFVTYPSTPQPGAVLNWESAPNGTATVTGPHRVGLVDTCTPNFARATSYSYSWYVNGALVSSLRTAAIRISEAYYLKSMSCVVVARGPGGTGQYQTDWRVIQVGPALTLKTKPYLFRYISSGVNRTSAKRGVREYATHGVWSPAGVSYTYQWYRGTTKISGATGRYYVPRSSDVGHHISCIVKAHRRGWTTSQKRTAALSVQP